MLRFRRRLQCLIFLLQTAATTRIYTLSLHDALPIYQACLSRRPRPCPISRRPSKPSTSPTAVMRHSKTLSKRSEEHTSELQSLRHLVCRLLLEKKKHRRANESVATADRV